MRETSSAGVRPDFVAEKRGGHHAPGDGFSVLVDAVLGDGFEGVAKVWPKFKISRKPDSRSSRLTTWALISRQRGMI